jgi:hypothetical protein
MKTALLVMALCLFTTAANAECAWVLWELQGSRVKGEWQQGQWYISSAFPNYDLCIQYRKKRYNVFKNAYQKWPQSNVLDDSEETSLHILNQNDRGKLEFSFECKCLPDTVDPRK